MHKRKKLFVDHAVQGALIWRFVSTWLNCVISVAFMMTCWTVFVETPRSSGELLEKVWVRFVPAFAASFLVLPIVLVDCVRMSNRFVGPLVQLRRAMRALADGEKVPHLHFRHGDYWQDLAIELNRISDRIERLEARRREAFVDCHPADEGTDPAQQKLVAAGSEP